MALLMLPAKEIYVIWLRLIFTIYETPRAFRVWGQLTAIYFLFLILDLYTCKKQEEHIMVTYADPCSNTPIYTEEKCLIFMPRINI